jgi:phage repressor protein C with HTH and peptisase S24 domain
MFDENGSFESGLLNQETMNVSNPHNNLTPERHFIVRVSGNSMDGGLFPIKDGDVVLLEKNEGGTISNQIFAVEYTDDYGETSYVLKRIEKQPDGSYILISLNRNYKPIPVQPEQMKPLARLIEKIKDRHQSLRTSQKI